MVTVCKVNFEGFYIEMKKDEEEMEYLGFDWLKGVSQDEKLDFFGRLISKNKDIEVQFKAYMTGIRKLPEFEPEKSWAVITDLASEFADMLGLMALGDFDLAEYMEAKGNFTDENIFYDHAEEEVAGYVRKVRSFMESGLYLHGISNAIEVFVAAWIATRETPIEDEYESLHEPPQDVICGELEVMYYDFLQDLKKRVFLDRAVQNSVDVLFMAARRAETRGLLNQWEFVFRTLTDLGDVHEYIYNILHVAPELRRQLPVLTLELVPESDTVDDEWEKLALELYRENSHVAIQLMGYYRLADRMKEFVEIALVSEPLFGPQVHGLLVNVLQHDWHPELYKHVAWIEIRNGHKPGKYTELRQYLSEDEKKQLISEVFDREQKIKMYLEEGWNALVFKEFRGCLYDLYSAATLLDYVIDLYPEKTFLLMEEKILAEMTHKVSRHTYQEISNILITLMQNPITNPRATALAISLYNSKPNRPALREEMRKAGVLGGEENN
ncbi:MAG: hypothetical protein KKA07_01910 [Bacteroidetes bacterium]|nr:hypothetical protein [Bacteroidota bacterium]MBU1717805.1 hypothetical protein [Bacteroidota bacterium]